jgi:ribosomal protein S14
MAKFCQKCGRKLSFFASGVLCRDCEIARKAELYKTEKEIRWIQESNATLTEK